MPERATRVLVVDDNEMNRDMLSRRLRRKGFDVVAAASGSAALEAFRREPVEAVILDIMMPDVNGIDVLRKIRETHPAEVLPVIMATARADASDVVGALELGANDYVTKPIDIDILAARLRAHLRTARAAPPPPPAPPAMEPTRPLAPPSAASLEVAHGTLLGGKYRLEEPIGRGGHGIVWRGRHVDLDKPVAVKILQSELLFSEASLRQFRAEGISACRVRHPNAVAVLDTGTTDAGVPYLVMELLEGHSLFEEMRLGLLPLRRCAEILCPVCDALQAAHAAGIVHRDVKPGNIIICDTPTGEIVKVVDFGLAKFVDGGGAEVTRRDALTGTPQYMAPERFRERPVDGAADVYSVAVTLYKMLTGAYPWGADSGNVVVLALRQLEEPPRAISELRPDLPGEVASLIMRGLALEPVARPSMDEMRDTLAYWGEKWSEPVWPLAGPGRPAESRGSGAAPETATLPPPTATGPLP